MGRYLTEFKDDWEEEYGDTVYLSCLGNTLTEKHTYAFRGWLLAKGLMEYEDE